MRAGNCDATYHGPALGSFETQGMPGDPRGCSILGKTFSSDQTVADGQLRHAAVEYMRDHQGRIPVVVAARLDRTFNLFRPFAQVHVEAQRETSLWILQLAMFSFWILTPLAIFGGVMARRRRIPIYPLVGFLVTVLISVSLTIGNVRYRAPAEIPIALLAAVGADELLRRWQAHRGERARVPSSGPALAAGVDP